MTVIEKYLAPRSLEEAVRIVSEGNATVLAGGTDLLPRCAKGLVQWSGTLVDLKQVEGLRGVPSEQKGEEEEQEPEEVLRVGACTPLNEIASDLAIRNLAPVLAEAAGRVACPQIRNRATIGGNLCNASPAADTAVPLILLDAVLELASWGPDGVMTREVEVTEFFRGPGVTVLAPGEILTAIRFYPFMIDSFAAWDKFGTRRAMEIAVASVGVTLRLEAGKVAHVRVGYGSVAPTPLRGRQAEAALLGNVLSAGTIAKCINAAQDEIRPITDVRAGEGYRREVVGVMLRRMLERAGRDRQG